MDSKTNGTALFGSTFSLTVVHKIMMYLTTEGLLNVMK